MRRAQPILLLLAGLFLVAPLNLAADWNFASRLAVTAAPTAGVFHHLEGAGRKHIAVSDEQIAVVWEDNSSGDPQVYLSYKARSAQSFAAAVRVSSGQEAYEPAVAALTGNRFVVVYEQDGAVYARLLSSQGLSEELKLSSDNAAGQASIASYQDEILAVWREKYKRQYALKVGRLSIDGANQMQLDHSYQVEETWIDTPLLKPTITMNPSTVCLAWEDRRAGHTRLLVSTSDRVDVRFSSPASLNEFYSNRNEYDKGNGVTRVAIAGFAEDEVLAAWMDKRTGGKGYAIYAALGSSGGVEFGPNEKVQSNKGDELPHYNPAVAGNEEGYFVVAWDDFRNGNSDIWLSHYNEDSEWNSDFSPSPASGSGEQTHASIALDNKGTLHLLWIERAESNAPSQLWYSSAEML